MRSMLQALSWDYFRYAGGLVACLWLLSCTPLLVFAELKYLGIQRGDPVMLLLEVSLLPFVIFVLMAGAATGLAPTRNLVTKPISNLAIASWRIGSGAVLLAIQLGVVIWFSNAMFDAGWPLQGAVLFTIAAWVVAQPFFCLGTRSLSGMGLTGLPLLLMCCWYVARYKSLTSRGLNYDWNDLTTSEALQLVGVIVVFSLLTVRCVAMDRCGDSQRPTRLYVWIRRTVTAWWTSGTDARKPYRSPQQAQFWFEWQSKGWLLPMVLTMLIFVLLIGGWLEGNALKEIQVGLVTVLFLLSVASVLVGGIVGCNLHSVQLTTDSRRNCQTHTSSADMLSSFQATRPLSDADFAQTLLKICASNVLLSLAVWLVGAAPVLMYGWSAGQPVNLRSEMHWSAPLFSFFITWAVMSNVMTAATTGRLRAIARLLVFALLVCTVVEITLRSLGMLRLIEAVEWAVLLALTAGIFGLTIWSYRRAYHRGHIRGSHIVIAAIGFAIILANGLICFQKISLVVALCVTCVALLSVLPWATSPLAIQWNRHR